MSDATQDLQESEELETSEEEVSPFDLPGGEMPLLEVREVPLSEIAELANIRQSYHGIEGLAQTMHLTGQLQPCLVRPARSHASHGKPYELIFGYRRKRAAELLQEYGIAGWDSLRCEIREVEDGEQLLTMIVENHQRENPSPVGEAKTMLQLKRSTDPEMSNAEIARRMGVDPSQVSKRLSMLDLAIPAAAKRPELGAATAIVEDHETDPEVERVMSEAPAPPASDAPAEDESPIVHASEAPDAQIEPELVDAEAAPQVDILEMVDKGEISASTAEIIASLPERSDQEKLAVLAKRHQWPVRKVAAWARKVKEHQLDEGSDEMGPIEWVEISDVVELPRLHPRSDISDAEIARITVYALLRNGMDREILEYLDEEMGYDFSSLWEYVSLLDDEQVAELNRRLALRYIGAAHRYHDLDPSLKDQFDDLDAEDGDAWQEEMALPAPGDAEALPAAEDPFGLPPVAEDPFGLPAAGKSSASAFDFEEAELEDGEGFGDE